MPEIDPMTRLALSVQTKKGTYALLIGSGLSSAAQIMTGWAITLDLIRRIAVREQDDPGEHPDKWYEQRYGAEPGYSDLLDGLTSTSADRHLIIRPYIEPLDDEREQGFKRPTAAHRSIASLVARGYIRVIVTTNFDHLLETALREFGIVSTVISTVDGIVNGALPLAHNSCTIIKVHGDYLDPRIRNTVSELSSYEPEINKLLDQVFHEYGLIVSGWSAKWDIALREALTRTVSPWFSTYWSTRSEPIPESRAVMETREATTIMSQDADEFFRSLEEGVTAIEDLRMSELVTTAMAEASLKRYIHDPIKLTRIRDVVLKEANRVRKTIEEGTQEFYTGDVSRESLVERLNYYEREPELLRALYVSGCYWGGVEHIRSWVLGLERLVNFSPLLVNYDIAWANLRYYPGLLTLYSGGIAALAAERYETLTTLLKDTVANSRIATGTEPLIYTVHSSNIIEAPAIRAFAARGYDDHAVSYYMRRASSAWSSFSQYVPEPIQWEFLFDQFEYLLGLAYADHIYEERGLLTWAPMGGLKAMRHDGGNRQAVQALIASQIETLGDEMPLLKAGLFDGSLGRLQNIKQRFDEILAEPRW